MVRTLRRLKKEPYPKVPKDIYEIHDSMMLPDNREKFGLTLDNKNDLYTGTVIFDKDGFMLFKSQKNIDFVKQHIEGGQRNYLLDGTFKIVPNQFSQLLIICFEYKNNVSI